MNSKLPIVDNKPERDNREELPRSSLGRVQPHTCPYKEEINNDFETLCTCDEKEMHECLMDI